MAAPSVSKLHSIDGLQGVDESSLLSSEQQLLGRSPQTGESALEALSLHEPSSAEPSTGRRGQPRTMEEWEAMYAHVSASAHDLSGHQAEMAAAGLHGLRGDTCARPGMRRDQEVSKWHRAGASSFR